MRVSINHLEIGDKVRVIGHEAKDIVGRVTNIDYTWQLVEVNEIYEVSIKDIRLEL